MAGKTSDIRDKDNLVEAIKQQKIVAGNVRLAESIAAIGDVMEVPSGTAIIQQGGEDNEVFLIVAGSFHIEVNGKTLARRVATDHVGEMAAISPVQRRAASVVAHEDSVAIKLSDSQMAELGEQFPQIWRTFALELAHRLEQRNKLASAVSESARVFIMASSTEIEAARAVEQALAAASFHGTIWQNGKTRGASHAIEKLEEELDRADVAVMIADRAADGEASRDSIVFELGFCIGRLGRHRTFLIEPRREKMELPHELAGINTITYQPSPGKGLAEALAPACDKLEALIRHLGPNR
jgi:CRP/FNR family transcriptional regulator, cyclic AMP receptor protein